MTGLKIKPAGLLDIAHYGDTIISHLGRAIARTKATIDAEIVVKNYVWEAVAKVPHRARIWLIGEPGAAPVASIATLVKQQGDGLKSLNFWLAGGERVHEWTPADIGFFERYAAAEGCDRMRIIGRRGWLRALPGHWYEVGTVGPKVFVMERALV